jgi:hypothetical protein
MWSFYNTNQCFKTYIMEKRDTWCHPMSTSSIPLFPFNKQVWSHLFLTCSFAKQCWSILGTNLPDNSVLPGITSTLKARLQSDFFKVAVILMCWSIWVARNDLIFNGIQPNIQSCKGFSSLSCVWFGSGSSRVCKHPSIYGSAASYQTPDRLPSFPFLFFWCSLIPVLFLLSFPSPFLACTLVKFLIQ